MTIERSPSPRPPLRSRVLRVIGRLAAICLVALILFLLPLGPFVLPLFRWRPDYSDFHVGTAGLEKVVTLPPTMKVRWIHDFVSNNRFLPWGTTEEWWVVNAEIAPEDWPAIDRLLGGEHPRREGLAVCVNEGYLARLFPREQLHGWAQGSNLRASYPAEPDVAFDWRGETLTTGRHALCANGLYYDITAFHPAAGIIGGSIMVDGAIRIGSTLLFRIDHNLFPYVEATLDAGADTSR